MKKKKPCLLNSRVIKDMLGELFLLIDGDLYIEFFTDKYRVAGDRQRVLRNCVRMIQRRVRNASGN